MARYITAYHGKIKSCTDGVTPCYTDGLDQVPRNILMQNGNSSREQWMHSPISSCFTVDGYLDQLEQAAARGLQMHLGPHV